MYELSYNIQWFAEHDYGPATCHSVYIALQVYNILRFLPNLNLLLNSNIHFSRFPISTHPPLALSAKGWEITKGPQEAPGMFETNPAPRTITLSRSHCHVPARPQSNVLQRARLHPKVTNQLLFVPSKLKCLDSFLFHVLMPKTGSC